jgi:hypothetical protein
MHPFLGSALLSLFAAAPNLTTEMVVPLELTQELRSGRSRVGERVQFRVDGDVKDAQGRVLIARGTPAYGTISKSRRAGGFGRRGVVDVTVEHTKTVDGQRVPLKGVSGRTGANNRGGVTAGFLLVSPLTGFMMGKNAVVPAGKKLEVYVDADLEVHFPADESVPTMVDERVAALRARLAAARATPASR